MKQVPFQYNYANLPKNFYQEVGATNFSNPQLLKWNNQLAQELGLDELNLSAQEKAEYFSGHKLVDGAKPVAQAYSGHQFGQFNPHLGDGRALLLGELIDKKNRLRDIHLKGSGPTQFSRRGDGYAQIGAVIREYLVSESLYYLNIPTTRTLALIGTNEVVHRETAQPGALQVRVAASHIRIGTFEYFVARKDYAAVQSLANFVIGRHHSDLAKNADGYLELFDRIVKNQISLVSKWMSVGFIHGVMNTDNTTISGETIDFGPCSFMEEYNPLTVLSSIDRQGRYAYARQASIIKWNLSILGHCFLTLVDQDAKIAESKILSVIGEFESLFEAQWLVEMAHKFGLQSIQRNEVEFVQIFLNWLYDNKYDYTLGFRYLSQCLIDDNSTSLEQIQKKYRIDYSTDQLKDWIVTWKSKLLSQGMSSAEAFLQMQASNPAYIARNHRVEEVIKAVVESGYFTGFNQFLSALQSPFVENSELDDYLKPADDKEKVTATFCNT